ncbi:MAG: inositol monophosphatase, partial [Pseudomonadota bacterium]
DLVTEADRAMEFRLRDEFEILLPGVAFVGEESVAEDPSLLQALERREDAVIVDPIDGTWNYAHGISGFGTLLALADSSGTSFGLLYDPVMDDWVWAARGEGTHHSGGTRLTTSTKKQTHELSGIHGSSGVDEASLRQLAGIYPRFQSVADLRASILDYRLISEGKLEFAVSRGMNAWDHAAGALAVVEAGGVAMLKNGSNYAPDAQSGPLIAAANPEAWTSVREAFAPFIN